MPSINLNDLNREQRLAAETLEGPLLVLAGAGSGKTRALTYRVANLIDHGVPPWTIMAITFTNKAAAEMRERIEKLVGPSAADVWVSTFHAGCAKILRRDIEKLGYTRSFTIYDDDDQMSALKEILKRLNIDEKFLPPREIKSKISDAKNKLLGPQEWFAQSDRDYRCQMVQDVYSAYEEKLKSSNALDFDDLIVKTLELFANHPPVLEAYQRKLHYIHVDEYQDTNYAQYMLVRLLAQHSRNLCVVGDDDQSIYGWRGADIRNILDFEKDFPDAKVIKLEQNYRSSANILDAANQVIALNENRKDKALWTNEGPGEMIRLYRAGDEREEAAWLCQQIRALSVQGEDYARFAVLYRTNAQSRVIEEAFVQSGVKYRMYGGLRFYDRKEVKDILAYLRVMINPADDISVRRIINVPKRSIGDTTVTELARYAAEQEMPLLTACMDIPETIGSRGRKSVEKFSELMMGLSMMAETMTLTELVQYVIDTTGLESQYTKEDNDENRSRVENIREFVGAVKEFEEKADNPTLADYLENVALVSDLDAMTEDGGAVTMMTLHSAKGLEFPNVFMVGMEENLFPSMRSKDDTARMEEERRLCYVGITRARERLYLTHASRRMLYNQMQFNDRSRFIDDIPPRVMEDVSERRDPFGMPVGEHRGAYRGAAQQDGAWRQPAWSKSSAFAAGEQQGAGGAWKPKTAYQTAVPAGQKQSYLSWSQGSGVGMGNTERVGSTNVSGVQRGMAQRAEPKVIRSSAHESVSPSIFAAGDHVMHKKFGRGAVVRVTGTGSDSRIMIRFDDTRVGVKEFALSIAPIIKMEG
ncbi:MAG: UvrD-helicase domain-containing protein [Clostridia bacterium]|nr:UvrD-helicase domain-containing protein [Clostridia bacterium]